MPDARPLARPTPSRGLTIGSIIGVLIGLLSAVYYAPPASAAGPCGPPVTSVIACENTLPGDPPSDWQVSGAGDSTIQGFATSMSVNVGRHGVLQDQHPRDRRTTSTSCGSATTRATAPARSSANMPPTATLPQTQPACLNDATTGLVDCGNWAVSASWAVPSDAVSGLYIAHLVRNDTGGEQPHPVRRAQRRQPLRHRVPDLRRDLAGLQHLRRQQPVHVHGQLPVREPHGVQGCLQGVLQPAVPHRAGRQGRSWFITPSTHDPVPGDERIRRQLHERPRRRHPGRAPAQPQDLHVVRRTTSTGRASSGRMSKRPATRA